MSDKELLEQYLSNFNNGVADNVLVVSPEELGQMWLYHISTDPKIKQFVPALTRRTALKEDRTVPRVSVAPTIVGCLLGYQTDLMDQLEYEAGRDWKGGWYIYGFSSEHSVLPGKKLLIDVARTDERWLVPYKADKWSYPAKIIGRYFYREVKMHTEGKVHKWDVEVVVEVYRGAEVRMFSGLSLTEGYWSFTFNRSIHNWKEGVAEHLKQLTPAEWKKLKGLHASMLSYQEPPSNYW